MLTRTTASHVGNAGGNLPARFSAALIDVFDTPNHTGKNTLHAQHAIIPTRLRDDCIGMTHDVLPPM